MITPKIVGFTIDSVLGDIEPDAVFGMFAQMFGGLEELRTKIWIMAVAIIVIAAVTFAFGYCRMYFNHRANQTLMRRMRNELFDHIQRLPLSWHTKNNTGDIIQRCTSDADTISNFVSEQMVPLLRIFLMLVISLVFMFMADPKLAAIAASFIPVLLGYSLSFYIRARKDFKKCDEEEGVLSTIAQENLTGVRVVRAFGRELYERNKFEKQNNYYTNLWFKLEKRMAIYWTVGDLITSVQFLFIIVIGTVFCVNGDLTAGKLVEFISYNTMMIGPVRMLGRIISSLSKANVSLGRIAYIMNSDEENYGVNTGKLSGDIVFDGVSFGYEPDKPVLTDISFTVPFGTTLGIIGATGSGKSTVACLMDKLYDPLDGRITIGGVDIKDISPSTVRSNIGFVMQEPYLFSRTVRDNIAIAAEDKSEENVRRAATTACVDDNITSFVNGYDTMVGERGVTLSGGQKQRVAIAQTIIRKTPYIIFDDSLSAVDSETDTLIRSRLKQECKGATTVIISHRITTVMHADNIIVMDGGRIAESGSHAELLEKGGIYKRIYDLQMTLPEELAKELGQREVAHAR